MKHKVRSHRWHAGRLRVSEVIFETLEEAIDYANSRFGADTVKIYTENGELVSNLNPKNSDTYA
jgi:hypothetical protein